jgi:predicted phosphate transport protein (TIGR00153 family)
VNSLFTSKSKELENTINKYIDVVEQAALVFQEGIRSYISWKQDRFEDYYKTISELENKADEYRHDCKFKLYAYMLIPESRGDVLGVVETIDDVVDICKKVMEQMSIEQPDIPEDLRPSYLELAELSTKTILELIKATRAFFTEMKLVENYINKVHFYEHEADKLEEKLKRKIFNHKEIAYLSVKMHLRYFVEKLVSPSDLAESVAERLSVYVIKRRL